VHNVAAMISTAAAQALPAAPAPAKAASSPALPASAPQAPVIAQTIQPIINLPAPQKLEWYELQGVWPSIAAVIAVVLTGISLHWNTTRQLRSARKDLEDTLEDSNKKATEDRKHTADEASLDRNNAMQRAVEDRKHEAEMAQMEVLIDARRAIYKEMLASYQKVQVLIGGLADTPLDQAIDPAPLSAMSIPVNEVWIWGEVDSAYQVRELYSQVNEFFYAALAKAMSIRDLRTSLGTNANNLSGSRARQAELAELIEKNKNAEDRMDKLDEYTAEYNSFATEYNHLNGFIADTEAQGAELAERLAIRRGKYTQFIIARQAAIMDQIHLVMATARADVGLKGDLSKLEAQSKNMSDRVRAAIEAARVEAACE